MHAGGLLMLNHGFARHGSNCINENGRGVCEIGRRGGSETFREGEAVTEAWQLAGLARPGPNGR